MTYYIISVGRNCGRFVHAWHNSLKKQLVSWQAIVVDDASSDKTVKMIKSLKDSRITLIQNETQKWAAYNRFVALQEIKDKSSIVVHLDLDDYLADYSLNKLDILYLNGKLLTMGSCISTGGRKMSAFYSKSEINSNNFCVSSFKFPHMRTFLAELALTHKEENFIMDGQWMKVCTDVAFCLPLLAQVEHKDCGFITDLLYIHRERQDSTQRVAGGAYKKDIFQRYCRRFR